MPAEPLFAPGAELFQRSALAHAAADIQESRGFPVRLLDLFGDKRDKVASVEAITDLKAGAFEADVLERSARAPGMNPKGENSLINLAELACAGEDAATIDEHWQVEGLSVFQRQKFRCTLGAAVER